MQWLLHHQKYISENNWHAIEIFLDELHTFRRFFHQIGDVGGGGGALWAMALNTCFKGTEPWLEFFSYIKDFGPLIINIILTFFVLIF